PEQAGLARAPGGRGLRCRAGTGRHGGPSPLRVTARERASLREVQAPAPRVAAAPQPRARRGARVPVALGRPAARKAAAAAERAAVAGHGRADDGARAASAAEPAAPGRA